MIEVQFTSRLDSVLETLSPDRKKLSLQQASLDKIDALQKYAGAAEEAKKRNANTWTGTLGLDSDTNHGWHTALNTTAAAYDFLQEGLLHFRNFG